MIALSTSAGLSTLRNCESDIPAFKNDIRTSGFPHSAIALP
jgi:hypothetical protein